MSAEHRAMFTDEMLVDLTGVESDGNTHIAWLLVDGASAVETEVAAHESVDMPDAIGQQFSVKVGERSDAVPSCEADGSTTSKLGKKLVSPPANTAATDTAESVVVVAAAAAAAGTVQGSAATTNPPRETRYSMLRRPRGRFVIIDNETFQLATGAPKRNGTSVDSEKLCSVFTSLGFNVKVHRNQTVKEMLDLMRTEAAADHSGYDCFGVAVLTHGGSYEVLYGVDNITSVDEFVEPIKNCVTLFGKPKLFFFQACRGESRDAGLAKEDGDGTTVRPTTVVEPKKIPREADFLYAYSTPLNYFSWRNDLQGSCFIQSLCEQLALPGNKSLELGHILTRVNWQVANEFVARCPNNPSIDRSLQVPSIVSMLTKELYFD